MWVQPQRCFNWLYGPRCSPDEGVFEGIFYCPDVNEGCIDTLEYADDLVLLKTQ